MKSITQFLAIGVLVFVGLAAGKSETESQIHRDREKFQLSTLDGFMLILDGRNGGAVQCSSDGRTVKLKGEPMVRFEEVIESPDAPDLLGGMSAKDWGVADEAFEEKAEGLAGPWLKIMGDKGYPKRTVSIEQEQAQHRI